MDNKTQELLANKFSKRFEEYNTKVLEELADIMKKFDGLTYSQAYKLAQQLKYDKSYVDIIDELSKLTGKTKKEIKDMLEEVVNQHIEFADTFYKAKNMKTPIYAESKTLQNIVNGFVNTVGTDFTNIAKSTGFRLLDRDKTPLYLNMKDTYHKVIDDCVYAVSQGKETYKQAIRETINQLYESGVRYIDYDNKGKRYYTQRIDAAVKRNILDGIRQVSNEVEMEFGKEFGADGIEVSVHSEPAPDHMYVQGHQFSTKKPSKNELSEFEKFQNDQDCVDVNGKEYPAESVETGRDRRSIGQYNCYHTIFSIIVGISKPLYTDEQLQKIIDDNNKKVKIDDKEYTKYEVTQLQRGLERKIREYKNAQIMYKKMGEDYKEDLYKEQLKINQLTNKYKEISKKANLLENTDNMAVSGYRKIKIPDQLKK